MSIRTTLLAAGNEGRLHHTSTFWKGKKEAFLFASVFTFIAVQLLFLSNMSYLYGSIYKATDRAHNFRLLYVDYDGGIIGNSIRRAGESLQASTFPTIVSQNSSAYPSPDQVTQAVFNGDYWGAVYVSEGASQRLAEAAKGGSSAQNYNPSNVITYIYNGARYPSATQGFVVANIQTLLAAAKSIYNQADGARLLTTLPTNDTSAALAVLDPWAATDVDLQPMEQEARFLYNTVSMVMPIIMQFFFIMALNGIASEFKLYSHLPVVNNGMIRLVLSSAYTFVGAVAHAGYIWAFREQWSASAGQYFLTVLTIWFYMHINFLVLDTATAFIPVRFMSFFVLTWVIMNVTSTIFPFEVNPGFFRWSYALPSHEAYTVLIQIWSSGGVNRLRIVLPIMFAWEIVMLPMATFGLHYRCGVAKEEARKAESGKLQDDKRTETEGLSKKSSVEAAAPNVAQRIDPRGNTSADPYFPSAPAFGAV